MRNLSGTIAEREANRTERECREALRQAGYKVRSRFGWLGFEHKHFFIYDAETGDWVAGESSAMMGGTVGLPLYSAEGKPCLFDWAYPDLARQCPDDEPSSQEQCDRWLAARRGRESQESL